MRLTVISESLGVTNIFIHLQLQLLCLSGTSILFCIPLYLSGPDVNECKSLVENVLGCIWVSQHTPYGSSCRILS